MLIGHQLAHLHKLVQGRLFPHDARTVIGFHDIENAGFQHEEPAIDQIWRRIRLFLKPMDPAIVIEVQMPEGCQRVDHCHGRQLAMGFVELDQRIKIDIRQSIPIGEHKRVFFEIGPQQLKPPRGHAFDTGIDQIDHPGRCGHVEIALRVLLPEHLALCEIDTQIAFVLAELGNVLLDVFAHIAERQHEVVVLVGRVVLHDMPEKRFSPDLDKWFGA